MSETIAKVLRDHLRGAGVEEELVQSTLAQMMEHVRQHHNLLVHQHGHSHENAETILIYHILAPAKAVEHLVRTGQHPDGTAAAAHLETLIPPPGIPDPTET